MNLPFPQAWSLLEPYPLFEVYDDDDIEQNEALHLANMFALMGKPPKAFLSRSEKCAKYFTGEGKTQSSLGGTIFSLGTRQANNMRVGEWRGPVPVPNRSFESTSVVLQGEEKKKFIDFIRRLLKWNPDERMTLKQAEKHPWLVIPWKEIYRKKNGRMVRLVTTRLDR